ncbi:Hsp33 family molecular chaperone HslO [Desulfuribacillus alkaliarsenatis]|uniref:33 kDa chaperonin n=1 Tax=Desulfuribacillus alkaliarsenatis TaxID=766136 RepID=A0A1E5FZ66_9FIRM|nr:Hsp33 family molecular chaperone HslO [Desulfuribacillus alkaliarsenatis]OEF95791.1 Hsp33 family molecular chaperone [Desulfuribacillus alkaliarsenatis]
MMKDYAIRATGYGGKVRLLACTTTQLMNELQKRHGTSATVSAALGRTVSIGAMMGLMHKGREKLTLQVHGDGPAGRIIVDADANGNVRGYVTNPQVDFPPNEHGKLDVKRAVGTTGMIYVVKDIGMKEPYQGSSQIVSGEIGEDFTYYFTQSEQTPSAVGVGVIVDKDLSIKASGGFIIQLFPGTEEHVITELEQKITGLGNVSAKIEQGYTPEELAAELVDTLEILEKKELNFSCQCNHDRIVNVIKKLGLAEVQSILEKEQQSEVTCNFCNEKYIVEKHELEQISKELEGTE